MRFRFFGTVLATLLLFSNAHGAGPVLSSHARFTVITAGLIRMEYSPDGTFVNEPSTFAVNRSASVDFKQSQEGDRLIIDTGTIVLNYRDNGRPFDASNLQAVIRHGSREFHWSAGQAQTQNLGGTLRTLDGLVGPKPLDDGVLSRDGWYLLDDSKSALFADGWIRERPLGHGGSDWYLFGYGLDYKSALKSLAVIGGAIPLPRKYTLGVWFSHFEPYTSQQFKDIVLGYVQHDFPLDAIVLDMEWHITHTTVPGVTLRRDMAWTGYTFDKKLIPDPPALLSWFHEQGLAVTLNDHPANGVEPQEESYAAFMQAMGRQPADKPLPFDASNKVYLDTFYQYTHEPRDREGNDFWWLDWQEHRTAKDKASLQILNWYFYTRSESKGLRGQSFSRWGGWGDQRYPIQFSGDASTDFSMLAFEVPFTSTGGSVGADYWTHDIGGHKGDRNEESYTRWSQFGALSASLRAHAGHRVDLDRRPWLYPPWAEHSMHVAFYLRSRLMPYLYTSMWQTNQTSIPFIRPMYLEYPAEEAAYHNGQEYQFGDDVLVAPITTPGVGPARFAWQTVWFPAGTWYDFFTGEKFNGPGYAVAACDIDTFPLYFRGGAPVPMQPYTARMTSAPIHSLVLRCYPGEQGSTTRSSLYEDDGLTNAYRKGEFALTGLTCQWQDDKVTLRIAPPQGHFNGQLPSREYVLEFPCTRAGASCSYPGATVAFDADQGMTTVTIPEKPVSAEVSVELHLPFTSPESFQKSIEARKLARLTASEGDATASSKTPADDLREATAAVQGIAVLTRPTHPYLLGSDSETLYLHNHSSAEDHVEIFQNGKRRAGELKSGATIKLDKPAELALPSPSPSAVKQMVGDVTIKTAAGAAFAFPIAVLPTPNPSAQDPEPAGSSAKGLVPASAQVR